MFTAPDHLQLVSDTPIIELSDVSARYWIPREIINSLKEYTIRWLQKRIVYEELWALRSISINIYPGEIFGIIGRNGAGKSTLLKIMARVLHPTTGRIITRGMVAPLLELGAGFHSELTGRENVYLNGALLGYGRREIDELLPWIIEFSEMQGFMDSPVRTYSTGMQARLGFAVAVCKRPEILLVDEVLSVGDTRFQYKCLKRMNEFRKHGTTILLVSHSMDTIRSYCSRALWLERGQIQTVGYASEVVSQYQEALQRTEAQQVGVELSKIYPSVSKKKTEFPDVHESHWVYPFLKSITQAGYEVTHEGGNFYPDDLTSRGQLAIFALRCMWGPKYEPKAATGKIYPDVPAGEWLSCYLEENYHFGLALSQPGQKYWPEMGVTRAQAIFVLVKASLPPGTEPPEAQGIFKDVPRDHWAARWLEYAYNKGYMIPINLSSTLFYPDMPVSRAETIALMATILGLDRYDGTHEAARISNQ